MLEAKHFAPDHARTMHRKQLETPSTVAGSRGCDWSICFFAVACVSICFFSPTRANVAECTHTAQRAGVDTVEAVDHVESAFAVARALQVREGPRGCGVEGGAVGTDR